MSKFTLGEVIDGLLSGNFLKASIKPNDDLIIELEINEKDQNRIYKREVLGEHELYNPFTPDYGDNISEWHVEYDIHYQPLDYLVIRYWKSHGAISTAETITFTEQCWIDSRDTIMNKHDFKGWISMVGFLKDRIIVFRGEVEKV